MTDFPAFIMALPGLELPFGEDVVSARAVRSDQGLVVFFTFHQAMDIPPHSHGAQWGTVIAGEITLTMGGHTRTYGPGETYSIPAGVKHAVRVPAGARAIDVFAEADRYALRAP